MVKLLLEQEAYRFNIFLDRLLLVLRLLADRTIAGSLLLRFGPTNSPELVVERLGKRLGVLHDVGHAVRIVFILRNNQGQVDDSFSHHRDPPNISQFLIALLLAEGQDHFPQTLELRRYLAEDDLLKFVHTEVELVVCIALRQVKLLEISFEALGVILPVDRSRWQQLLGHKVLNQIDDCLELAHINVEVPDLLADCQQLVSEVLRLSHRFRLSYF